MLQIIIVIIINFLHSSELDNQNKSFPFGMANCVESFNGNVYAASGNGYFGGLYVKESNKWKLVQKNEFLNNSIRDLINLDSNLIIATDKGVYSLNKFDKISELNEGLPADILQNDKSRVLKMIKHGNLLYLTIDAKDIYYTDINKISWSKLNINYNKHIFDFAIFQDNLFISLLDIGLVKFNLSTNNIEIVNTLKDEIIYLLHSTDKFIIASTGFSNFVSHNSILWKDFNLEYKLNSNPILSLHSEGDSIYIADNTNLYYSYNSGEKWLTYNIFSQFKTNTFVHNINKIKNNVYLSLDDFGVFTLDLSTLESSTENISNYKVNQIKAFNSIPYYNISNLNYSYLYKIENDIPELIYTLKNDVIMDFSIQGNEILILTRYNGLLTSKNGLIWEYFSNFNGINYSYNYIKQKVDNTLGGVRVTNIDNSLFSYYSTDRGKSWIKIEAFGSEEILGFLNYNFNNYSYSKNKIFRYNHDNNREWDIIYESENIIDLLVDEFMYFIEKKHIYRFDNVLPTLLPNSEGAERLISGALALFEGNTLKYNYKDNWITLYKFQYLSNEDITDIHYIDDTHIQFGTKHLGLFDLYLEYLSVDNKDNDKFLQFQNSIYTSNQSFNIRVFDLNGLELLNKINLTQYDIRSLENTKCLMIFEIGNNIIVKKHLLD